MALRKTRVIVFVGFACLVLAASPFAIRFTQVLTYSRHQRATADLIVSLKVRCPPEVDAMIWDEATGWAITAYHNICFSDAHVPLAELKSFKHDVAERLTGDVDLNTVDWIWIRLEQASPYGREYAAKFEPVYRNQVYRDSLD